MNRNELFSDELIEKYENTNLDKVKINKHIGDDIKTLEKNYTILLDYCCELENRNQLLKNKIERLERWINIYESREKERESVYGIHSMS